MSDLTVIICTKNRSRSLALTLESLAKADTGGLGVEVRLVDNGSTDDTHKVVEGFSASLPIQYFFEPTSGVYGKSHALNTALEAGGLGSLVAVIDDDITVREDWFKALASVSTRWEEKAIFGGTILVAWPDGITPLWALDPSIRSWLFSAIEYKEETPLEPGMWFSGNHFWFRSKVLDGSRRFKDIWLTEPDFILGLVEDGYQGLASPEAVVWHRVQRELLVPQTALKRAQLVGRSFARVRTQPVRKRVKQSVLLRKHPIIARLFCLFNVVLYRRRLTRECKISDENQGFCSHLVAVERFFNYMELMMVADEMAEYSRGLWGKVGRGFSRVIMSLFMAKALKAVQGAS